MRDKVQVLKNLLLLDVDTDYVENFAIWAGLHVRNKVCLHILTNPSAVEKVSNGSNSFDYVLVTPSMLLAFEQVPKFNSQWTLILLDDGKIVPDSRLPDSILKTISKYQSVRTIFECLLESTLPHKAERTLSACSKKTESIFCLSAGISSGDVPFAAAMAMLLSSWRRKVFYLDFEFGLSQNPFFTASEGMGMCDLLLHAKRTGQKETQCIHDCTCCDPLTGVYTFRDGAGAFDHEEMDLGTIQWLLSELVQQSFYDDIVIHAGTRFGRSVSHLFWHADGSILAYDGLHEVHTKRCQNMLRALLAQRPTESVTNFCLLPILKDEHENAVLLPRTDISSQYKMHTAIQSPKRGLNWMKDTTFLESIAGIILPQIQGRG